MMRVVILPRIYTFGDAESFKTTLVDIQSLFSLKFEVFDEEYSEH